MARDERDPFTEALGAIRRRERTTAEIVEWLAERDYGPEEIESAVGRLTEFGELDDARFAREFAQDKRELAGWGPERIAVALRERGIDRGLVEAASLETHAEQVERAVALLRERRFMLADDSDRRRALALLGRRGYGYEVAHEAIRLAGRGRGAAAT
jgi:regulatory protein